MRPLRWILLAAASAMLLVATMWLLDLFAQQQLTAHLRDQAAHALALAARGDTPYRWQFGEADSIIAGRVFGAAEFRFEAGETVVRSDGAPFDIGVPLSRPIDIERFPQLHIAATVGAPALMRVVVYESLQSPEQVLEAVGLAATGSTSMAIDLAGGNWREAGQTRPAPRRAAVLRLRFSIPSGGNLRLRSAELLRATSAQMLNLQAAPQVLAVGEQPLGNRNAVYRLPSASHAQEVDIAAFANKYTEPAQPLILLPQHARAEQQIALRNAVFDALPGAILLPERALDASFAQARTEVVGGANAAKRFDPRWPLLGAYALVLVWTRARPARSTKLRAAVEAALALAGPLWLILGEPFDGKPDLFQQLLIGASVVYAISLSMPRRWQWFGTARAWAFALAVVLIAGIAGLLLHETDAPIRAIGSGHVARYVAWALVQQYLICAVCTERWLVASGNRAIAVYLGALGFALLHTPNAALMLATMLGGLCWCALYLRERALLPLAVSHAASALILLALLPRSILASAEVSARFFQ